MINLMVFSFAVVLGSLVSGMTGLGGGVILLAFMTPIFPPAVLIPLHGTIQLMSNVSRTVISPKGVDMRFVLPFLLGSIIGALSGMPLQINLTSDYHTIIIAIAILVLTWVPKIKITNDFRGKYIILGFVETFFSLFIGSSGPLVSPFFLSSKLEIKNFVPTKSACQIFVHLFKVLIYFYSGFSLMNWAGHIALAFPLVIIGATAGKYLVGKIDEKLYRTIIKIVITILALRMVYEYFF